MSILHGSWIKKTTESYFFIWGETWRSNQQFNESQLSLEKPLNPYCFTQKEFSSFLNKHRLNLNVDEKKQWQSEVISLPSYSLEKESSSYPLLSNQLSSEIPGAAILHLSDWQVEGIYLQAPDALKLFKQLPLNLLPAETNYSGGDLRFWCQVSRWILSLLSRSKFLASFSQQESEQAIGQWFPLLDSRIDQARFAKFTQEMPSACLAYYPDEAIDILPNAQDILLSYLQTALSYQLRSWIAPDIATGKSNLQVFLVRGFSL